MARRRLAALLGADAADDDAAHAVADQPDVQPGADQRAVARLDELGRRRQRRQLGQRTHQAGGSREGIVGLLRAVGVQHAHDGHAARRAAFDQRVLRGQPRRVACRVEIRAMAERLLRIDQKQTGLHRKLHDGNGAIVDGKRCDSPLAARPASIISGHALDPRRIVHG
ncbi:hypothetical protein GALL_382400 [mine drainage metagenome]|uniref:Uncharacterized protein n=1 Tax=mine drainage metagenome TaxID=410659 RepID=A0A1J5Q8L4_9ZZZZ